MTARKANDHALDVLLDVRQKHAPDLDESLLRDSYEIEKQFQFDRDREVALVKLRRLVETAVKSETALDGDSA